jgi:hypothetical protein
LHKPRPGHTADEVSAQPRQEEAGGGLGSEEADVNAGVRQRLRAALDRHRDLRAPVIGVDKPAIPGRRRGEPFEGEAQFVSRCSGRPYDVVKARQVGRVELAHLVEVGAAIDGGRSQTRDCGDSGDRHRCAAH